MKTRAKLLLFLALTVLAASAWAADPAGPSPIPADQFHLDQYQGKVVFVDFWASWCKPCQKSLPWLSRMQSRYGSAGLQVVAVNLDENLEDAADMVTELPKQVVLVHDPEGKLAQQYKLEGMPTAFIFDRAGKQVACHLGFKSKDAQERENELENLLKEGAAHEN